MEIIAVEKSSFIEIFPCFEIPQNYTILFIFLISKI